MDTPSVNLNTIRDYAEFAALAFAGSFLRASKWQNGDGKIVWGRVFFELPVAIATGSVGYGIGEYFHLAPQITGGICGLLGLLGPAFFTSLGDAIVSVIKSRFGKGD